MPDSERADSQIQLRVTRSRKACYVRAAKKETLAAWMFRVCDAAASQKKDLSFVARLPQCGVRLQRLIEKIEDARCSIEREMGEALRRHGVVCAAEAALLSEVAANWTAEEIAAVK